VHPGGRQVACCYQPANTVKVWDTETGRVLWTTPGIGGFNQVAYSPDGRFLAVSRPNVPTSTEVLDTTSGRVVSSVLGTSPVFLGDGRRIATRSPNGVKVWDTADGQLLVSLSAPGESYSYLGTSSDGRRLAAGTSNGDIRVWDAPREVEETGGEV